MTREQRSTHDETHPPLIAAPILLPYRNKTSPPPHPPSHTSLSCPTRPPCSLSCHLPWWAQMENPNLRTTVNGPLSAIALEQGPVHITQSVFMLQNK